MLPYKYVACLPLLPISPYFFTMLSYKYATWLDSFKMLPYKYPTCLHSSNMPNTSACHHARREHASIPFNLCDIHVDQTGTGEGIPLKKATWQEQHTQE
jgi:hypothetical protein